MEKCIIFCAGGFSALLEPIGQTDYVIAADGGLRHTNRLGLTPNAIIGDFDSLGYVPEGATVFPVEKDDTDAMLAVRKALALGYREVIIYGGLDGPRLDHTLANLQTLQYLADRGVSGYLVGETHIATVIRNEELLFPANCSGILSLFCMGADARGVTLTNLKYTLQDGTVTAGFPIGVSNHFIGKAATVAVKDGSLTLLYERINGIPGREKTG